MLDDVADEMDVRRVVELERQLVELQAQVRDLERRVSEIEAALAYAGELS
jgi:hypothetical protein